MVVRDSGSVRLQDTASVTVTVADENDNAPVFASGRAVHLASVSESAAPGTALEVEPDLAATDADAGENGAVRYSLSGGPPGAAGGIFRIDPDSGEVAMVGQLDRESVDRYHLTVHATDGGDPPFSSSTALVVEVLDANDNGPVFSESDGGGNGGVLELELAEDTAPGAAVHRFSATDADAGENGRVTYRLGTGGGAGRHFYLDPLTGVLILRSQLDRETSPEIRLTVTAVDGGGGGGSNDARSADISVVVTVTDVNDNSPRFPGVSSDHLSVVTVPEDARSGTVVARMDASDADEVIKPT